MNQRLVNFMLNNTSTCTIVIALNIIDVRRFYYMIFAVVLKTLRTNSSCIYIIYSTYITISASERAGI